MAFMPVIEGTPALMDPRIFRPQAMGLKDDLIAVPLAERFTAGSSRSC